MGGLLRRYDLGAFIAESASVDSFEESLSPAQKDGRDRKMHLVYQALSKILPNSAGAATNADILAVGRLASQIQRLVNAAGDEEEGRAAFHLEGRAGVMG